MSEQVSTTASVDNGPEQQAEVKKAETKKPKQSFASFFKGFGKGFLDHVVIPGLKKLGFELIKSANNDVVNRIGDFIFQGEKKPDDSKSGNVAYEKKFQGGGGSGGSINGVKRLRVIGHSLELVMDSEVKANSTLQFLYETLDKKGYVSIADLYEYLGRTPQFTYNRWGWTDFVGSGVRQIAEGWYLDIPDVRSL